MKRILIALAVAAGLTLTVAAPSQAMRDTTWACPTC